VRPRSLPVTIAGDLIIPTDNDPVVAVGVSMPSPSRSIFGWDGIALAAITGPPTPKTPGPDSVSASASMLKTSISPTPILRRRAGRQPPYHFYRGYLIDELSSAHDPNPVPGGSRDARLHYRLRRVETIRSKSCCDRHVRRYGKDDKAALAHLLDLGELMSILNDDYALQTDEPRHFTSPEQILDDLTGEGQTKKLGSPSRGLSIPSRSTVTKPRSRSRSSIKMRPEGIAQSSACTLSTTAGRFTVSTPSLLPTERRRPMPAAGPNLLPRGTLIGTICSRISPVCAPRSHQVNPRDGQSAIRRRPRAGSPVHQFQCEKKEAYRDIR